MDVNRVGIYNKKLGDNICYQVKFKFKVIVGGRVIAQIGNADEKSYL